MSRESESYYVDPLFGRINLKERRKQAEYAFMQMELGNAQFFGGPKPKKTGVLETIVKVGAPIAGIITGSAIAVGLVYCVENFIR